MLVLGIDPGLAHMGLALFEVRAGHPDELVQIGLVETEKDKSAATATGDVLRRLKQIVTALDDFVGSRSVRVICAEGQSNARDARAASMQAMAWGVLVSFAVHRQVPILVAYPATIKKAAGVSTSRADRDETKTPAQLKRESKRAVQQALALVYPKLGGYLGQLTMDRREHPADAVGAFHALRADVRRHAELTG